MNREGIPQKLKHSLEKYTFIKVIALVGSYARTDVYTVDPNSDMEIYILCDDEKIGEMKAILPTVISDIKQPIFYYNNQWTGFAVVFNDLFRLEIPVQKLSEVESVFSRPASQPVKVILDRSEGKLEAALIKRPTEIDLQKLFADKYTDFWYMATVGIQYLKKGELFNARSVINGLNSSLVKFFELYNDPSILLLETNKRVEKFLTKKQLEVFNESAPAYNEKSIKNAYTRIIEEFTKISMMIKTKYRYNYPVEIEERIRPKLEELIKR